MLPITLTLAAKLFGLGFSASAALVAARRSGPHVLFGLGLLLSLASWLVTTRLAEWGIPIESGRDYGYMLTLDWFAVSYLPAAAAVHLAAVWRIGRTAQSLVGAAILTPALLVGTNCWVA
jgi:hypothetical protein